MTTKIEWTDETWNPVTGCTKVSQGCKNCYAERLAPKVFAGQTVEVNTAPPKHPEMKATAFRPRQFTDVRYHPERLELPLRWNRPRRVFVNSMSDLFHEDVPDDAIKEILTTAANALQHQFQILTKRPARMQQIMSNLIWITGMPPAIAEYQSGRRHLHIHRSIWREVFEKAVDAGEIKIGADIGHKPVMPAGAPENIWLGVSVEDQDTADERIPLLLETLAAVRFISYEPALGPIDLRGKDCQGSALDPYEDAAKLNWVIAGGESGPGARPAHPDWFRSVRDQCAAAGVAFFFKQWGEWAPPEVIPSTQWRGPHTYIEDQYVMRAGKKNTGRQLDGREHSEYPA